MKRSPEARWRMVHGRRWSVYEATGDPKRPLRFLVCMRANAKSIARGIVHRGRNIPKSELVVVDGCPSGTKDYRFGGARRRRKRKTMTAAQLRDKIACKVFGGKACR